MTNNKNYQFSQGSSRYVIFDSNGYVLEAKGFDELMWSFSLSIDKDLVGKHVDELAEMLRKNASKETYINFELKVHLRLLKLILKDLKC